MLRPKQLLLAPNSDLNAPFCNKLHIKEKLAEVLEFFCKLCQGISLVRKSGVRTRTIRRTVIAVWLGHVDARELAVNSVVTLESGPRSAVDSVVTLESRPRLAGQWILSCGRQEADLQPQRRHTQTCAVQNHADRCPHRC